MKGPGVIDLTKPLPQPAQRWAQERIDDEVVAAGVFLPNARGRWSLAGFRGVSQRQELMSRGAYLSERVVLALTAMDLYVVLPVARFRWHRDLRRVARADLRVVTVANRTGSSGPALWLHDRRHRLPLAELVEDPSPGYRSGVVELLGERTGSA